ncbi:MAG: FmdB family transcriptional regulator [Actinobacteria bacterium]|nr:FmdB family transcriptional regulator [Actinomycetota bacterium]
MPTYEYRCKECDHTFEAVQSFTDEPLTECPSCGGPVRKLFGNVGISFKGSGFYRNDSRSGTNGASTKSSTSSGETGSAPGSSSPGSSSDSPGTSGSPGSPGPSGTPGSSGSSVSDKAPAASTASPSSSD